MMKKNLINYLLCSAASVFIMNNVNAAPLHSIQIQGNQRIESETILSYIPLKKGEEFSDDRLDETLKSLYSTGYFIDVNVSRSGNSMIVKVDENPIINRLAYEGNSKLKDDIIEQEIKLRPREVLTRAKIQDAQQRMLEIYRRMGRYGASVNPKVIKLDQNRVDLVFEIDEGDVTFIRKITFVGNKAFKSSKLEEQLKSKQARWYRFFASDDVYDPDRFTADQQELRKFYYDNGYPDARIVTAQAELSPDSKDFFLTFQIEEGERYTIGDVKFNSSLPNVKAEDLQKVITFGKGDSFSGSKLEQSIIFMTSVIGQQGYAFVAIEPVIKKNPKTKVADITFEIKEGPRVYIEKIVFQGNDRTRDHVIRREMLMHEGDAYNSDHIKASEQNIKNLDYFKKVEVETEQGSGPDQANLLVKVEEQPTGEIGFSGGFSTMDGPLAQIKFVERNLMGTGRVLSTDLSVAKKRQDINVNIIEPYFLGKNLQASLGVYSVRSTRFSLFTHTRTGISAGIGYNLAPRWSQTWNYSISMEHIKNAMKVRSPYITTQSGKSLVSVLGHTIAYDKRNSMIKPTNGYRISFSTSYAGLGGSVQYLQNILAGSTYFPISEDVTFIMKAEGGTLHKIKRTIRSADRFSLGANSFRGFEYGEIGPRDTVTLDALGGTRYWTGTAELVFPLGLPSEFGVSGAVFTDVGSIWRVGEKKPMQNVNGDKFNVMYDNHTMRASVGFGITWDSPFGPICIDYARTVKRQKKDVEQRILFGFSTRH